MDKHLKMTPERQERLRKICNKPIVYTDPNKINQKLIFLLEEFTSLMEFKREMYKLPELQFYKEWVENLGGKIAPTWRTPPCYDRLTDSSDEEEEDDSNTKETPKSHTPQASGGDDDVESDVELSREDVVEDEDEDMPEYGDITLKTDDSMIAQAEEFGSKASIATAEGRYDDALDLYTEAVKLNPTSASLYTKRAGVYIKMKKPKKAIHDCTKAIELKPDCDRAYKWRGKANKMLGNWVDAFNDLTHANQLEPDDDTNSMLKNVTPNATKLMDHKRRYDLRREELEKRKNEEKVRKAREVYEQQKEQQSSQSSGASGGFAGYPGAFPGSAGGMPGMPDLNQILSDPELIHAIQDPEVSQAFQDVALNPANITRYETNPKIKRVLDKMSAKFGGGGRSGSDIELD